MLAVLKTPVEASVAKVRNPGKIAKSVKKDIRLKMAL